jgi:3-deoxy-7-phosphoheptulonate synthase
MLADGGFIVIAGPCAVESEDQLFQTARAVAALGASVLRGGAFKPRTSPYDFQGLGEDGLKLLAEAGRLTGLPVVTEALSPGQVDLVARYAGILQIGSRSMENSILLQAAGGCGMPVLLKRGMTATLDEYTAAAEIVSAHGCPELILCERGIRTFGTSTRNTLDLMAVPQLQQRTGLPVIVDPSHSTGVRHLIPIATRAAVATGADGVIVEVHPNPDRALSDGAQSLTISDFRSMMHDLEPWLALRRQRHATAVTAAVCC